MNKTHYREIEYNDKICIKCGSWYEPEELIDDGICKHCKKTKIKRKDSNKAIYDRLISAWNSLVNESKENSIGSGFVYFIRGRITRRIKIGYVEDDIFRRLIEMQVGSPDPLELIGIVNASYAIEQKLHSILEEYNTHGEWFEGSPSLIRFIKHISFLPERKPNPSRGIQNTPWSIAGR